jgi:hypothetical protein
MAVKKTKAKKATKPRNPDYAGYEVKLRERQTIPYTDEPLDYLSGGSVEEIDKPRPALRPGRRVSRNGNIYWELRRNRADLNPAEGL